MNKWRLLVWICLFARSLSAQETIGWQQRVDTRIRVSLDDVRHFLHGDIEIKYVNNSPDTLPFIYVHLYPNAYKTDRTPYEKQAVENGDTRHYFSTERSRGYIDSLDFYVAHFKGITSKVGEHIPDEPALGEESTVFQRAKLRSDVAIDIVRLELPERLLPGDSLLIRTPFRVKIPESFSRLGHVGQSYQISQWFPKPAVYDQDGWHPMSYLDLGEFYSEFGSYEVDIDIPANYIVMASGQLSENSTELQWLDSLSHLSLPSDTLFKSGTPESLTQRKVLNFKGSDIHDFAWFADKRWVVRKDTVLIPGTQSIVTAYACFFPEHQKGWAGSLESIKKTLRVYSEEVGPYPYPTAKAVEGGLVAGGGMEYPMVTVIAPSNDPELVNTTIIHEVGHNWFYGILASNERAYPWLDEGINSFYERKLTGELAKEGSRKLDEGFIGYSALASIHRLLPADTHSAYYPPINYGVDIYYKTALYLKWLEAYMTPDTFRAAMQDYYQRFRFRHPEPADFEDVFREHSRAELDWFFDVMASASGIDYRLERFNRKAGWVDLKNKTVLAGPVKLTFTGKDAADSLRTEFAWSPPFTGFTRVKAPPFPGTGAWKNVYIAADVPDYYLKDNSSGESFGVRPFGGLNLSTDVWALPAIGYNYYDGFMTGIALHNISLPQNPFQFALAPAYGWKSRQVVGTAIAGYHFYFKQSSLHNLLLSLHAKSFHNQSSGLNVEEPVFRRFAKVSPAITLNFRKPYPRSSVDRKLLLKVIWIREDRLDYERSPLDSLYRPYIPGGEANLYGLMRYAFENNRTLNPYSYHIEGQVAADFAKVSMEGKLKIHYYNLDGKGLRLRAYIGKMFPFSNPDAVSRYQLTATYSGANDYLYEETFLARNENSGWLSNQVSLREGGFKIHTLQYANPLGRSDNWLAAFNASTDLPLGKLPLRVFADLAFLPEEKKPAHGILYAAGLELGLTKYVSVYLPLVMSKNLMDYAQSILGKNRLLKMISFRINFSDIPWLEGGPAILKMF